MVDGLVPSAAARASTIVVVDAAPAGGPPHTATGETDMLFTETEAMTRHTSDIDSLIERLAAPESSTRVRALWDLAEHGARAVVALPRVIAALEDHEPWVQRSAPSFDGDWHESYYYPSQEAVHALAAIDPAAAVEEVAVAVCTLEGLIERIDHPPASAPVERRIRWERDALAPFGAPLVAALERLSREGPPDRRAAASSIAARWPALR